MIRRRSAPLQDLNRTFLFGGQLGQQFLEHFGRDQPGAAADHQDAVPLQQAQPQRLEPAVAAHGFLDGTARAGKARRIEDHHAEAFALGFQGGQVVEHVGPDKLHALQSIDPGVVTGQQQSGLRDIHAQHAAAPARAQCRPKPPE